VITINRIFILIFILTTLIFSGCIREDQATTDPTLPSNAATAGANIMQIPATIEPKLLSNQQSIPEIKLVSFTSAYGLNFCYQNPSPHPSPVLIWDNVPNSLIVILRSNTSSVLLDTVGIKLYYPEKEDDKIIFFDRRSTLNQTEKYYAVYDLSITNNGLNTLNFTIYDMYLRNGDQIFNTTPIELPQVYPPFNLMAENATISPGQNLTGCIIFQVNSYYDKSFQLMYNSTPIISESFERNVEALTISENFNYSTVFDTPQFNIDGKNVDMDDLEPDDLQGCPLIWPNWVDRSTVEFYKKLDHQNFLNHSVNVKKTYLPCTTIRYVLSVAANKNITIMHGDHSRIIIVDDGKEEIFSNYMDYVAILGGQTYDLHSEKMPQMNISNATIVQTKFYNRRGLSLSGRLTSNRQIVVLDENQNIVITTNRAGHFVS